uniref:Lectin n=1 Tax=Vachellia farnesiana TaxID=72368 RepID=LEC_VACFA|nr:RecName: Full=Lectin; Short=AFAL [Vachellia farnesiana]
FKNLNFNEQSLILQGDATVSSTGRLTNVVDNGEPRTSSLGRAFYSAPIWDKPTGRLASWREKIQEPNKAGPADGMAFALVPVGSEPKDKGAGLLGLFDEYDSNRHPVAVEFDTCYNLEHDPKERHSIRSIATPRWDFPNGENAEVLITYDEELQLLVASLVYPGERPYYLPSDRVEIEDELPEYVIPGFSATRGLNEGETHDVLSWSFASKMPDEQESEGLDLAE